MRWAAGRPSRLTPSPPCAGTKTRTAGTIATALESYSMTPDAPAEAVPSPASLATAAEISTILHEKGWLRGDRGSGAASDSALVAWIARAAELLGPHAVDRASLGELMGLLFTYDAAILLRDAGSQEVLARAGAREVLRELANRTLDGGDMDSDRFKAIIEELKQVVPYRSRAMFHPIRLALAGRAGEGELDRIILLLDDAARLDFAVAVKGTRQRMLEFCAALD
jgi:hypothetical protein